MIAGIVERRQTMRTFARLSVWVFAFRECEKVQRRNENEAMRRTHDWPIDCTWIAEMNYLSIKLNSVMRVQLNFPLRIFLFWEWFGLDNTIFRKYEYVSASYLARRSKQWCEWAGTDRGIRKWSILLDSQLWKINVEIGCEKYCLQNSREKTHTSSITINNCSEEKNNWIILQCQWRTANIWI